MSNALDMLTLEKRRREPEGKDEEDNEQSEHKQRYVNGIRPSYWTLMSSLAIIDSTHCSSLYGSLPFCHMIM